MDFHRDVAPSRHMGGSAARLPDTPEPNLIYGKQYLGESKGGPQTPRSYCMYGGRDPPCVRPTSGEGGMDLYVRVVP